MEELGRSKDIQYFDSLGYLCDLSSNTFSMIRASFCFLDGTDLETSDLQRTCSIAIRITRVSKVDHIATVPLLVGNTFAPGAHHMPSDWMSDPLPRKESGEGKGITGSF